MPDPEMSKFKIGNAVRNLKDAVARRMINELEAWIVQVLENATETLNGIASRLTAAETKLSGIENGAEVNDIDTVKVNGTALPITGKAVDISVPSYSDATQQTSGLMSAADKTKLDGVAAGADENVIEEVQVNGTALPVSGKSVNVPVPSYSDATPTTHGLMSASDKGKLDGIAAGATAVTVDAALSDTSENPVQNKVIKGALDGKANDADVVKTVNGIAPVQGGVTLPVDSAPESGSGNLISSDAVYQALMDAQTLLESIYLKLTGGTVTGAITSTREGFGFYSRAASAAAGFSASNATTGRGVSMQINAAGTNRGIYDNTGSKWMMYCDVNDNLRFSGVTDATKGDLGITDLEDHLGNAGFVRKTASPSSNVQTFTFTAYSAGILFVVGAGTSLSGIWRVSVTTAGAVSYTKMDSGQTSNIALSNSTNKLTVTNNSSGTTAYLMYLRIYGAMPT